MPSNALVSVVVPSFNHGKYVVEAVESALGQSHPAIEVVVVDDGSADDSVERLRARFAADPRVRLLSQENRGAHAAINRGVRESSGEFVAILNSDDRYHPERFATLLGAFEGVDQGEDGRRGEPALLFSDVAFIDDAGSALSGHERIDAYREVVAACADHPAERRFFVGNPAMTTSNFLFRRALFDAVGGFAPLRYTHDWDWVLRACAEGEAVWLREPLMEYRVHGANTLSEGDAWRHLHENAFVQAAALAGWIERGGSPELLEPLLACWLDNASLSWPMASLFLTRLLAGEGRERLLELALDGEDGFPMRRLAERAGLTVELLQPLGRVKALREEVDAGARMIDERDAWIEDLRGRLSDAEAARAAQAGLIDERDAWVEDLRARLADAERARAAQTELIDERDAWVEDLRGRLAETERAQAALIDERDAWIEDLRGRLADAEQALAALRGDTLVRAALRGRRLIDAAKRFGGKST